MFTHTSLNSILVLLLVRKFVYILSFTYKPLCLLARNTRLTHLNVCWNQIGGKGAVALFRALMVTIYTCILSLI